MLILVIFPGCFKILVKVAIQTGKYSISLIVVWFRQVKNVLLQNTKGSFSRVYKNSVEEDVLATPALLVIAMPRLFLIHCLVCCIKNNMHGIISKRKDIWYKITLHKYSGKDVKMVLRAIESLTMLIHTIKTLALLIHGLPCINYTLHNTK